MGHSPGARQSQGYQESRVRYAYAEIMSVEILNEVTWCLVSVLCSMVVNNFVRVRINNRYKYSFFV